MEQTKQPENTIVFYCADNGASGRSPNGSVNENKFFNGYPDELSGEHEVPQHPGQPGHLQPLPDRLGGGLSTPFQMFKRYSQFAGNV